MCSLGDAGALCVLRERFPTVGGVADGRAGLSGPC